MNASAICGRICVAYVDETTGASTTWRFADTATDQDYFIALLFAASWAAHNRRRARPGGCVREFSYETN